MFRICEPSGPCGLQKAEHDSRNRYRYHHMARVEVEKNKALYPAIV